MNVYKVTSEGDCEGRTTATLGYATGNRDDILAFFDDRKMYNIELTQISILNITPETLREKQELAKRKIRLEKEIEKLKEDTKRLGLEERAE